MPSSCNSIGEHIGCSKALGLTKTETLTEGSPTTALLAPGGKRLVSCSSSNFWRWSPGAFVRRTLVQIEGYRTPKRLLAPRDQLIAQRLIPRHRLMRLDLRLN